MINQKVKKIICCASFALVTFFVLVNAEASSRRVFNNQGTIKEMKIQHKEMTVDGNHFDVYINQDTETVTVRGQIEVYDRVDWNEVQEIKKHFNTENPGNYEFVYEFKFNYDVKVAALD